MERQNLAMRMRRLTAPVNAFSKKLDNLMAAVAAYLAYCKFCRFHQSLRITGATGGACQRSVEHRGSICPTDKPCVAIRHAALRKAA
ncbi:MAG: hypothetical protein O7C61_01965, partial [SAR324 cluster bacterium]|nr:hypothetical protein [SAR324 cluster bacterium]